MSRFFNKVNFVGMDDEAIMAYLIAVGDNPEDIYYGNPFSAGNALIKAVLTKDLENVAHSLENGGDVKASGVHEGTILNALHIAARYNYTEIVKYLIEVGSNVNAVNSNDETPLHEALNAGSNESAKILIENDGICKYSNECKTCLAA